MVLCIRTKQGLAAANAFVSPGRLCVLVLPGEGWFRSLLPCYKVLILRELLLPLGTIFAYLLVHDLPSARCHSGTPRAISDSAYPLRFLQRDVRLAVL